MSPELNLRFPDETHVEVTYDGCRLYRPPASICRRSRRLASTVGAVIYGRSRAGSPVLPDALAVAWHQLGRAFEEAGQWDEAEKHYRESARISEGMGNLVVAAKTWNHLAIVNQQADKPAAEAWYRKAIERGRKTGDLLPVAFHPPGSPA
jgi:tetratricopeptide (TPR) repeat protein